MVGMEAQRALAAILFTDAVGFSGRVNLDESKALAEIERDFTVMRESCARHDGQVLKSLGDGLLMVFTSAVQAVLCAIDIQDRLQKGGGEEALLHRIGIHLGDVLLTSDDAQGDGVNIASRLEQEAMPGGICISGTIYDVVKSRLTVQVRALGEKTLKNIAEPIQVYEIGPAGSSSDRLTLRRKVEPGKSSMAPTYAIFFLGLCILGAAGIYFVSNKQAENDGTVRFPLPMFQPIDESKIPDLVNGGASGSSPEPSKKTEDEARLEEELAKLRELVAKSLPRDFVVPAIEKGAREKDVKAGSVQKTESVQGGDPDSPPKPPEIPKTGAGATTVVTTGNMPALPKSYEEARRRFGRSFRFKEMADWVQSQDWADSATGQIVDRHWQKLVELEEFLLKGLSEHPKENPLETKFGKVYSLGTKRVMIVSEGDVDSSKSIAELRPSQVRMIVDALARESNADADVRPMLRAYDLEFLAGGLGMLAGKKFNFIFDEDN